ncbi:MAG: hypothetical protein JXA42_10185 [Anaerolineales bacterium]|nr:hypothetical protein [Anaerolineales bacterium]
MSTELQVLHNGKPLPDSASDPEKRIKTAYSIVFFIAGLSIILGILNIVFRVEL